MTAALAEVQQLEATADKHLEEESPIPLGNELADAKTPTPITKGRKKKPAAEEKPAEPAKPTTLKLTVNRAELHKELSLASGVVERKVTIPILSHVLLQAKDGKVELRGTDLEVGIIASTPAKVASPGTVCVPVAKLLAVLAASTDDEIKLEATNTFYLKINAGRAAYRLAGMSSENFPDLPKTPLPLCSLTAASLRTMIDQTQFAVSSEESRYTLNGALLELGPKGAQIVATDGHRLSLKHGTSDRLPEAKLLIHRKALSELSKILKDAEEDAEVQMSKDDSHLFFEVGDRTLIARQLTGQFPNYKVILPKTGGESGAKHDIKISANRLELISTIKRVSLLADERSSAIKLELKPSSMHLEASSSDAGESEDDMNIETLSATTLTEPIGFNFKYLLDWLQAVEGETITAAFIDCQSSAALTSEDGGLYVVMPMRV